MNAVNRPVEVRAHQFVPGLGRQFAEGALLDVRAGVVDEYVDRPEGGADRIDHRANPAGVGNVHCVRDETIAALERAGGFVKLGLVPAGDGDACSGLQQECSRSLTDAAATAGDEGDLVRELCHRASCRPRLRGGAYSEPSGPALHRQPVASALVAGRVVRRRRPLISMG